MIRYPKPKDFIKSRIHDALLNGERKLEVQSYSRELATESFSF